MGSVRSPAALSTDGDGKDGASDVEGNSRNGGVSSDIRTMKTPSCLRLE